MKKKRNENEASEQYEETAIDNDILYNNNEDIVDGKIQLDNQSDKGNISKDFKISITSPSQCREKLVPIRNLTYDIHNEGYSVFDKVNEYLESVLYLLRNATKKENGITVRPKKDRFERKRQLLTFLKKEQPKFQKELDSPITKKQKVLNLLSTRK